MRPLFDRHNGATEEHDQLTFGRKEGYHGSTGSVGRRAGILRWTAGLLERFAGRFEGKTSPVHFFWHGFDLALTRFSGRRASPIPGANAVTREAYSHEVASFGFWPGDAYAPVPAFYAYAAPVPAGYERNRSNRAGPDGTPKEARRACRTTRFGGPGIRPVR